MLGLIFLFVKCLEILYTWRSKHTNWQSVHILFLVNCFCFADRPVEGSTPLEQRNFMRTKRSWCGSGTKSYRDCWPAPALTFSDSGCRTLADQVPPVLATSTRSEGLWAPACKVSLGRVQPGLRDAAVYPHTHAGTADKTWMIWQKMNWKWVSMVKCFGLSSSFLLSQIRTLITGKTSSLSVWHAVLVFTGFWTCTCQNIDPSNLAISHLLSWHPITECPLLPFTCLRWHAPHLCHMSQNRALHGQHTLTSVWRFCSYVRGHLPVYLYIWWPTCVVLGRLTDVRGLRAFTKLKDLCHMLKDEQVK